MKIKRFIKKIIRTIFIWMTIALLVSMPVYAEFLETTSNPPNYMVGTWWNDPALGNSKWLMNVKLYDEDQTPPYEGTVLSSVSSPSYGLVGFWVSKLEPETYYHFTIPVNLADETETGNLLKTNTQFLSIVPDETFVEFPATGSSGQKVIDPISPLPSDYYDMFYDATNHTLSAVFYLPADYVAEHQDALIHTYILISLGSNPDNVGKTVLIGRKTITATGIYSDVLAEIRSAIEQLASSAGGITKDQVKDAVIEAIDQFAGMEQEAAEGVLGSAQEQIEAVLGPLFTASDTIRQSLSGITDALTYTGTDGILVLPEGRNPFANNALLWPRQEINLVSAWNSMPQALRSVVTIVITMGVLTSVAAEVLSVLEMWNTERDLFGKK